MAPEPALGTGLSLRRPHSLGPLPAPGWQRLRNGSVWLSFGKKRNVKKRGSCWQRPGRPAPVGRRRGLPVAPGCAGRGRPRPALGRPRPRRRRPTSPARALPLELPRRRIPRRARRRQNSPASSKAQGKRVRNAPPSPPAAPPGQLLLSCSSRRRAGELPSAAPPTRTAPGSPRPAK